MSSLKSGALLSLFSGFSFEGVQRPSQKRHEIAFDRYPAPVDRIGNPLDRCDSSATVERPKKAD